MTTTHLILATILSISTLFLPAKASSLQAKRPELSREESEKLQKGELIVQTQQKEDQVWPEVTIYTLLKAPPKVAMAVFSHFEHQKNYVPGLLESQVVDVKGPREVHTKYEMSMPWPIDNSHYIHGTVISPPQEQNYHLRWYDVQSDTAEDVKGEAYFFPAEKFPDFASLMIYKTHMNPKSAFAGLLKDIMLKDVEKSLHATKREIHRVWKNRSSVLKTATRILEKSLEGENPYADASTGSQ